MTETVTLKTAPELARIVRAAFPDYRKHTAYLKPFSPAGESINSYWDGGSRALHAIVNLNTGRVSPMPTATHPYFDIAARGLAGGADDYVSVDAAGNVRLRAIPPGFVLVTAGTTCGKPATAYVKCNPADLTRYLPAGAAPAQIGGAR